MKLAIMQPYFFPYIGYWQLLNHVDRFVIYDDVNYIKRGWINRNRILINGDPKLLVIPLRDASQNKAICDHVIDESAAWRAKMLRSVDNAYRRAPYFSDAFPVINSIISCDTADLAAFLKNGLVTLSDYLGITTQIVSTSRGYDNAGLLGQGRIMDICNQENCDSYVNLEGGRALYDSKDFDAAGLSLEFLSTNRLSYAQRADSFTENMSIVDVLMAVGREGVRELLPNFSLVE